MEKFELDRLIGVPDFVGDAKSCFFDFVRHRFDLIRFL